MNRRATQQRYRAKKQAGNNIVDTYSDRTETESVFDGINPCRFPWRGDELIVAIDVSGEEIIACADESGIHDTASFCVLAGYIGSFRQWLLFEERWERVLSKYDVLDFHSKEFFAYDSHRKRVGRYNLRSRREERHAYGDWPDEQAKSFQSELLAVIDNTNVDPIGAMVDIAAFRAFTYGERKFFTGGHFDGRRFLTNGAPSRPYHVVFDHCLIEAANKTKTGKKLIFIFDQQKTYESRALQQFQESVGAGPSHLRAKYRGALFVPRTEAPGLQAADLYAHCWYRYSTDEKTVGEQRRDALDVLTSRVHGMGVYNAAHLEGLLKHLPEAERQRMRDIKDPNEREDEY